MVFVFLVPGWLVFLVVAVWTSWRGVGWVLRRPGGALGPHPRRLPASVAKFGIHDTTMPTMFGGKPRSGAAAASTLTDSSHEVCSRSIAWEPLQLFAGSARAWLCRLRFPEWGQITGGGMHALV